MPGVNRPVDERFLQIIGGMHNQIRAMATQQQASFTDGNQDVFLTFGLIPGSNPALYGIQVIDAQNGNVVLYAGSGFIPDGSGREQEVLELWRDDGSPALALADLGTVPGHTHQQALAWFDRSGNTVFADDTDGGQGIARPHLAGPYLADTNAAKWPATAQTTWTSISNGYIEAQQPKLSWIIQLYAPASTTGQFRLLVAGQQVGTTQTVVGGGSGNFATWSDTELMPSGTAFGSFALIQLQAQVTAGTGTIAAQALLVEGVGT